MANIFREALEIWDTKRPSEMTGHEQELVAAAMIPLLMLPVYTFTTVEEGLEELARMVEEAYEGIS